MTENPIDRLIKAKEARIASAERSVEKLKIEVAALREARQAVAIEQGQSDPLMATLVRTAEQSPSEPRKGRSLSAQWKQVLKSIGATDHGADLDQVYEFCQQQGIELLRPTLRAQMSNYVGRHYLHRTEEGRFVLTKLGRVTALVLPKEFPATTEKEAETPR